MNLKSLLFSILYFILFAVQAQNKNEYPYKDSSLQIDQRVEDLISRMTLEEKVYQLFNEAPAIERLGIPRYNWWNECLHGVARAGKATVFPQAIGMAATFDQELMLQIGTAISDEARAKHHNFARNDARYIYMGLTFWTPNINIFRDPRWGRGQETYGEDPYLTGRMAVNFINGLQGNDPNHLKVIATAKHYAVHSGPESSRHIDNLFVNDRDLWETYLPAFEATVKEANVQSVMCAYNRFRDKPCCGSDLLLSNILRRNFGFTGYVVSDCGAISDFYTKNTHNVVETPSQAFGWSLASGTDLNCEENRAFIADNYEEAVKNGIINEADINASVKRLFKARFLLGMFDNEKNNPYAQIPMSVVGDKEHLGLTLQAAEKSLVLLKNDGILPFKNAKKIALIGPNANNFSVLIGNYNGDPINPITPVKAFREKLGANNVFYTPGCPIVPGVYTDFENIDKSVLFHISNDKIAKGLKAEYFENPELTGTPKLERVDENIDFYWEKSPINHKVDESFGVRWSGILIPSNTGNYQFSSNLQIKINGIEVADKIIDLKKGEKYELEAILRVKAFWWSSNHQQQYASMKWTNTSRDLRKEAIEAASKADVIVFCGGISPNLEGEEMKVEADGFHGGDRTHIYLPKIQEDLIKELHKTGKPIVYVNMSGSAVAMNWQAENLSAIVQAFYPGEATGTALVRTLFGDNNPSGRLPVTFYKSVDDLPGFKDYRMEGRTYRYYKGEPLYEFGFGLSYTTFKYSNLKVNGNLTTNSKVSVSVDVTNIGKIAGDEVAQLYLKNNVAQEISPLRSLIGFKRLSLNPGETKTVTFDLKTVQLAIIDKNMERAVIPGSYTFWAGGKQPDEASVKAGKVVHATIDISGERKRID
jgi:beta-glucosidase